MPPLQVCCSCLDGSGSRLGQLGGDHPGRMRACEGRRCGMRMDWGDARGYDRLMWRCTAFLRMESVICRLCPGAAVILTALACGLGS